MTLDLNGEVHALSDVDTETPLLWVIRDHLGLTGTKYGCGRALCGACTVLVDGMSVRSCAIPLAAVQGKRVTTIEGISGTVADAVRNAWAAHTVPQCGYCQPGQVMSAIALLHGNVSPGKEDVDAAMSGNICRCGTYPRIRSAIASASDTLLKLREAGA